MGVRILVAVITAAVLVPVAVEAAPDRVDPPAHLRPSPARVAAPAIVAVVGDSISQGTGANGPGSPGGAIGSPRPAASWATGDHRGLESYVQRLEQVTGEPVVAVNLSANGATLRDHLVDQVRAVPAGTELVLVQMGGNDLCRPSVESMTPVDVARGEVRAALTWLGEHRPDTLVYVTSIPDVYALWYVRGAAHRGEQYPFVGFFVSGREGPRAPRSFAENNNKRAARLLWDTLGVIPCQSLLADANVPRNAGPTPDPTHPAEQRRLQVRTHNQELNRMLADECAAILRCSFDGHALFDTVSNRDEQGVLLADKSQWRFVDADISTQDHFHPSFSGQRKLAEIAWAAGPDWTDTTPPTIHTAIRPTAPPGGVVGDSNGADWFRAPVEVEVVASDDRAVRGIEYRVHPAGLPAGDAVDWIPVAADHLAVPVVVEGESWVEVRALDVNGNQSASTLVPVRIDRHAPTVRITAPFDGQVLTLGAPVVARYECAEVPVGAAPSGLATCESDVTAGVYVDASRVGEHVVRVRATDRAGNVTVVEHTYHVRYAWSGTTGPLERGAPRSVAAGSPLPVHFTLHDARGHPVPDAAVEVVLVGPDGLERTPPSVLSVFGIDWTTWSAAHGGHLVLVDTRGLQPGVWDVLIRPDDGSERRVNVLIEA